MSIEQPAKKAHVVCRNRQSIPGFYSTCSIAISWYNEMKQLHAHENYNSYRSLTDVTNVLVPHCTVAPAAQQQLSVQISSASHLLASVRDANDRQSVQHQRSMRLGGLPFATRGPKHCHSSAFANAGRNLDAAAITSPRR